ncbi:MAG TPA: hypothetical protein VL860_01380 [Planctomycetota bacterium]|nr:hypothetical protein [Planctomycetota bacterium]
MPVERLPISLIIDDGSPINQAYYLQPQQRSEFLIPNRFTHQYADLCNAYDIRGKFTVMPAPSSLGRIDVGLNRVPLPHLKEFLAIVRRKIAPTHDITPEILTHQQALRLPEFTPSHLYEDEWVARASVKEMVPYFSLALQILKNVGLPANGFTSPWNTGITNEKRYAQAIGLAQWRVHRRAFTWYFLHVLSKVRGRWPSLTWKNKNVTVVMVPANTTDYFWNTQKAVSRAASRRIAREGVDLYLSKDGKHGRLVELISQRVPLVFLTHWQSLFANGRHTGLAGLEQLFERIRTRLGDRVEWMTCSDIARLSMRRGFAQRGGKP